MSATFPTSVPVLTNPAKTDKLSDPSHADQHANANDEIEALATKLGTGSSTATSAKLLRGTGAGTSAWDKTAPTGDIVGTTDEQTLTNKTLTSPTITNKTSTGADSGTETLTNKTLSTGSVIDANATVTEVLKKVYPVGAIYTSVVSTTPATLFGFGTWEAFGAGKVMVGIDSEDEDFDTAEKTGGAKTHTLTEAQLASHTHTQDPHNHTQNAHSHKIYSPNSNVGALGTDMGTELVKNESDKNNLTRTTTATNNATTAVNQSAGSGQAHNNLQPYIVVYMWKRTA